MVEALKGILVEPQPLILLVYEMLNALTSAVKVN